MLLRIFTLGECWGQSKSTREAVDTATESEQIVPFRREGVGVWLTLGYNASRSPRKFIRVRLRRESFDTEAVQEREA